MIVKRFGDALIAAGAVVGVGAVVAYSLDLVPTLPPEVMKLIIYKLLFIGALGMIIVGALARKLGTRASVVLPRRQAESRPNLPEANAAGVAVPERVRDETEERASRQGRS
jgi:hypothetical protein